MVHFYKKPETNVFVDCIKCSYGVSAFGTCAVSRIIPFLSIGNTDCMRTNIFRKHKVQRCDFGENLKKLNTKMKYKYVYINGILCTLNILAFC